MNNICQQQNTERGLELLAAQRQLYSDAKKLQIISVFIGVPVVITWSILGAVFPPFLVYAALWGITATFLDLLLFSRLQKSVQEKAAKIQQIFDCEVLQFDWAKLNCGIRINPETIVDASNKYKRKNSNYSALRDWYPISVCQLPIHQARIICQRSNIWWDANLRRRYSNWIIITLIILTTIVFLISLVGGLSLAKFLLAVIAPLTPAFVLGLRQYSEHHEAAARLDRLHENAENILDKIINKKLMEEDIERESYSLQVEIYENRRRSPSILDWFYSLLRRKHEEQMNKGAESLVKELMQNP